MLSTSENGKNLIKEFEGLRLEAYKCSSGRWTIGYGHTGGVREGDYITKATAEYFFDNDIKEFENAVNRLVSVPLTQNQFDALVSFCFNNGYEDEGFGGSTMRKLLNSGDYAGAAGQFERWVYSGGKVSAGLKRRRILERDLFLKKD